MRRNYQAEWVAVKAKLAALEMPVEFLDQDLGKRQTQLRQIAEYWRKVGTIFDELLKPMYEELHIDDGEQHGLISTCETVMAEFISPEFDALADLIGEELERDFNNRLHGGGDSGGDLSGY